MKNYTAIYKWSDGAHRYSFTAYDGDEAIAFCKEKFLAFPLVAIMENRGENTAEGKLVFVNGVIID